MNSKMTTNSQLATTKPKKQKQKLGQQLEQENHRIESQKWRSHGGLSVGRERMHKKHNK